MGLERFDEITTRLRRGLAERDSTRSPPCVGPTSSTDHGTRSTQHVPPRPTPLGVYGPFDNLCACVFIWCETMMRNLRGCCPSENVGQLKTNPALALGHWASNDVHLGRDTPGARRGVRIRFYKLMQRAQTPEHSTCPKITSREPPNDPREKAKHPLGRQKWPGRRARR